MSAARRPGRPARCGPAAPDASLPPAPARTCAKRGHHVRAPVVSLPFRAGALGPKRKHFLIGQQRCFHAEDLGAGANPPSRERLFLGLDPFVHSTCFRAPARRRALCWALEGEP